MFRLLGLASCIAGAPSGPGAGTAGRAVSFTESGGYTRINKARNEKRNIIFVQFVFRKFVQDLKFYFYSLKGKNCWSECGERPGWAGMCSFCGLSNGSPGFCCHPDGRGTCSAAMIAAVQGFDNHQCVVPKVKN